MKLRPITVKLEPLPADPDSYNQRPTFELIWTDGIHQCSLILNDPRTAAMVGDLVRRVNEHQDEKAREMGLPT